MVYNLLLTGDQAKLGGKMLTTQNTRQGHNTQYSKSCSLIHKFLLEIIAISPVVAAKLNGISPFTYVFPVKVILSLHEQLTLHGVVVYLAEVQCA